MKNKEELRRLISEQRAKMQPEWTRESSLLAQRMLVALPEFRKALSVCCYMAVSGETETDLIIERCWKNGKKVCVPAFRKEIKAYGLAEFRKDMHVVPGRFGVSEPENPEWKAVDDVDFIVVPGLAFDPQGGRVGHGGGYYDRILEGMKKVFKAGLAFEFQIFDRVPMLDEDVRMDAVITEKRVLTRIKCV
ncbi:MAG: 5-formyltetrahydrofolate cyclo-ligase [Kiritimatiellae bacterium]|nr:5-formyltetrahydrofolate cyclo-ligase [Kiritimatiellia bacterium]MDD5519973.1 5-formyltetrahydrofolate cyclo-ligase [Kiritimatiellia bacterium]